MIHINAAASGRAQGDRRYYTGEAHLAAIISSHFFSFWQGNFIIHVHLSNVMNLFRQGDTEGECGTGINDMKLFMHDIWLL